MLVLREIVADFIVIPFLRHEDVSVQVRRGRRVECTHCDGDPVSRRRIPEQRRSARGAETAPHLR